MCALLVQPVYANESSNFFIRIFGSTDTEAPTTPTLLTATPIASTQIDIAWAAATDNFSVAGYVVFRNGLPVSTTTLSTYSDTGLSASTTYSYFVRAFDPSLNYSSSSNIVAATTQQTPVLTPEESSGTQSTATGVVLDELRIVSGVSTSTFYIKTARPARFEVRWGRTTAYELGYTVTDSFAAAHMTTIADLEPRTRYEYEVIGYNPRGIASVLERGHFMTQGLPDLYSPTNVSRFVAVREGVNAKLSWEAPSEPYQHIRVVRSHLGFPSHIHDGAVVYQGKGGAVIDKDILTQHSPVYYTVFVVGLDGAVSSGAVAMVYAVGVGVGEGRPPTDIPSGTHDTHIVPPEGDVVASTSPQLPVGTRMPDVSELFLVQGTEKATFSSRSIVLDSEKEFLLIVPKEAVFENLKTIIVTFTDPTDAARTYSFLLKLNKDKTAYEAVIAPVLVEGQSRLTIDIYDYKSAVVGTYIKTVTFSKLSQGIPLAHFSVASMKQWLPAVFIGAFPFLCLLLFVLFYYRRRRPVEDNV
jgi:hypothetical protein